MIIYKILNLHKFRLSNEIGREIEYFGVIINNNIKINILFISTYFGWYFRPISRVSHLKAKV